MMQKITSGNTKALTGLPGVDSSMAQAVMRRMGKQFKRGKKKRLKHIRRFKS